ncbi:MAG: phytanoyl-CoA dioxygenase family protein [Pseudomonadota bacterium]
MNIQRKNRASYFRENDCHLADFAAIVSQETDASTVVHAEEVVSNIPVYDAGRLEPLLTDSGSKRVVMAEFAHVLLEGPGVLTLKGVYGDTDVLDEATEVFSKIIASEKEKAGGGADHFAKSGANDRIWNSLQKLCIKAPDVFARYHARPTIDAVCEAWLGPNYQMTAQVNLIRPGGEAQQPHRDYHLGFQTAEISASYPAHAHALSPVMTLQGGIAHVDVPIEAGPTKLLPFSQLYGPGYAAWRRDDFRHYFEDHHVQLPLEKGDAIFFNPALFHAGGANKSEDIHRLVNLLQVSSAFGRAMETVDRFAMCKALYPALRTLRQRNELTEIEVQAAVAACAEGYSFPTNLDSDPPVGGLAPKTQNGIFHEALASDWEETQLNLALDELFSRQRAPLVFG